MRDIRNFINIVEDANCTELSEQVIIHKRAMCDAQGKVRDLTIHLNPGRQETVSILNRASDNRVRGFVNEKDGSVVIWDAYMLDHAGADELLSQHGYDSWWNRFEFSIQDFAEGRIHNYIDDGIDHDAWMSIPTKHLARMFGREPVLQPQL